jgi:hypothetical protein
MTRMLKTFSMNRTAGQPEAGNRNDPVLQALLNHSSVAVEQKSASSLSIFSQFVSPCFTGLCSFSMKIPKTININEIMLILKFAMLGFSFKKTH